MDKEKYRLTVSEDRLFYEFYSIGPKGLIPKVIIYQKIGDNIYNLAFGDVDRTDSLLDDLVVTDNKDTEKVILTVAYSVFDFFAKYESAIILVKGSSHSRTRLYRRYISIFMDVIAEKFILLGELKGNIERFERNKDYTSFLIFKK